MALQQGKAYIQKNPLFGRKVLRIDRIRESVWDWDLCDVSLVTIDKEPSTLRLKGAASSIYDHQGLEEIPVRTFDKIFAMAKLLDAMQQSLDPQQAIVLRQETLGRIIALLSDEGIIDDDTYSPEQLRLYSEQYDRYSRQQMEKVTDVMDVHK